MEGRSVEALDRKPCAVGRDKPGQLRECLCCGRRKGTSSSRAVARETIRSVIGAPRWGMIARVSAIPGPPAATKWSAFGLGNATECSTGVAGADAGRALGRVSESKALHFVAAGEPGIAETRAIMPHLGAPITERSVSRETARLDEEPLPPSAAEALAELSGLVTPDGARFTVERLDGSTLHLQLLLEAEGCERCVLPRHLLEEIFSARLQEADAGITHVAIADPREA